MRQVLFIRKLGLSLIMEIRTLHRGMYVTNRELARSIRVAPCSIWDIFLHMNDSTDEERLRDALRGLDLVGALCLVIPQPTAS